MKKNVTQKQTVTLKKEPWSYDVPYMLKPQVTVNKEKIFFILVVKLRKKTCNLIIDGGSYTNAISEKLVNRLQLSTMRHPRPYKLKWLDEDTEVSVRKQVLVNFSIGGYKDEVLCDVVPMDAYEVLLERPWKYDRKTIHDGETNVYKV